MNNEPVFDVMQGTYYTFRVLQWATAAQVADYCARMGLKVVSERQIGLRLREITVA